MHNRLDYAKFEQRMRTADRVTILNTWIPNLELLEEPLEGVIRRGGEVQILTRIHRRLPSRRRCGLQVRMFDSQPSMAVYQADDRYLVSVFPHGRLAINSAQFDIRGDDTELGRQVRREIDTLWQIGREEELG